MKRSLVSTDLPSSPRRGRPSPVPARALRLLVGLIVLGLVGCGGKASPGRRGNAPLEQRFPALRWVPPGASLVVTSASVEAGIAAARTLIAVGGMAVGVTVAEVEAELAAMGLPAMLSPADLGPMGVDLRGGIAGFAQGVSPTLVFRLSDPAAMQAYIDRAIKGGAKVASVNLDGVEVHRELGDGALRLHWAMADGWMWVHFELRDGSRELLGEPTDGWFTASRGAAGAAAAEPDLVWAFEATSTRAGPDAPHPVLGLARTEALLARVIAAAMSARERATYKPCQALAPRRVALAVGAGDDAASGVLVADGGGLVGLLAAARRPTLAAWAEAREGATVAVDVGVGLAALAASLPVCLEVDAGALPVETVHAFAHELDLGGLKGRGALDVGTAGPMLGDQLEAALDQIPGRSAFERGREFGPFKGKNLSVPMFGEFDYVSRPDRVMVAMGGGLLARAVGAGATETGPLVRLELRPTQWPRESWDTLLGMAVQRTVTRGQILDELLRWSRGLIEVDLDGELVVVRARGDRAGVAPIAR